MVLMEEYPWQTLNILNSSSLLLLVFDYKIKPALYSVRLSVRTSGFHPGKRSSILLSCTSLAGAESSGMDDYAA